MDGGFECWLYLEGSEMATYFGSNGEDSFSITGDGNVIHAGNGMDTASVTGRNNEVYGENGADNLSASYFNLNPLIFGGLAANNLLDGGRGDDLLSSLGAYGNSVEGIATKMTGGSGNDTFFLRQSSDTLVNNPTPGQTTVTEGSVIQGVFDLITDYQAGELIDVGATTLRTSPVSLQDQGPGHSHLILNDNEYAFIHGDYSSGSRQFTADEEGADLLLVYDYDPTSPPGEFFFEYGGSVVLVGVTDEASVNVDVAPV
jgi:Ca2+-binding RTX toxin-like protein